MSTLEWLSATAQMTPQLGKQDKISLSTNKLCQDWNKKLDRKNHHTPFGIVIIACKIFRIMRIIKSPLVAPFTIGYCVSNAGLTEVNAFL